MSLQIGQPPISPRPEVNVKKVLRGVLILVVILGAALLVYGTGAVYRGAPPIPAQAVGPGGQTVFTGRDVVDGKAVFQRFDLMDYGSLYGNGAYFGPDFTAQGLHRIVGFVRDYYAVHLFGRPYGQLHGSAAVQAADRAQQDLRSNRVHNDTLNLSAAEVYAYQQLAAGYDRLFSQGDPAEGLGSGTVPEELDRQHLSAFFFWSAWTTAVNRPGLDYSYTNNWPYDPGAGNVPTTATFVWTWISYLVLFGMMGLVIYLYLRFISPGFEKAETRAPEAPAFPDPTPSQLKTGKYFLVVALLLLVQILAGVLMAHYYAQRQGFYGLPTLAVLPFNVLKAWHLQLAVLWIAVSWLGAGIFIAPLVAGHEPRRQGLLVDLLWGTLVVVGLAVFVGMWLGIEGYLPGNSWFWFGNQGLEYLELGRAFQIAVLAGMGVWAFIMYRAFVPAFRVNRDRGSLERLLLYSGLAIAFMYVFGMFPVGWIMNSFTLTDFWRWWVVHLWVEGAFEFFAVVVTAFALVALGLVDRGTAENATYFELILVFLGGIVGTGHHFYWIGDASVWLALGSMFSFLEVLPLLLLVIQSLHQKRLMEAAGRAFPQQTAFLYLAGSGFWNFVGAGVFGGLINSPLMNYYEHGSFLTLAHAHLALFGAFGLLGIALMYFALRFTTDPAHWDDTLPRRAFWLFNAGMVLWLFLNFLPIGFKQLVAGYEHGYWFARSLAFYNSVNLWQWLRMPGDILFGLGALLLAVDIARKVRRARRVPTLSPGRPERA